MLDLRGLSPVCDFVVIGTGTSSRQMKSAADDALELAEAHGASVMPRSRPAGSENWIALDLIDIIVHLFTHEARSYYDLDNLWADADEIDWKRLPRLDPADATKGSR